MVPMVSVTEYEEELKMKNDELLHALDDVFQLAPGSTKMEDRFQDISDFSSLTLLVLIAALDEDFGVMLVPETLFECETVADLAAVVRSESVASSNAA
jgi:acyl carrier protein